jgi:hypothetical protein
MKTLVLLFVFSSAFHYAFANKIDDLKTDADVAKFVTSLAYPDRDGGLRDLVLKSTEQIIKDKYCAGVAESWGIKNWEKADLNNDGRTDLLVNMHYINYGVFAIIDKSNRKFLVDYIGYSDFEHCELAKTIKSAYGQLVLFHTQTSTRNIDGKTQMFPEADTLIYKFDDFIELNKKPSTAKIASVKFHSGTCYGTCPDFQIKIDSKGNGSYQGNIYDKRKGRYNTTIKSADLKYLFELLAYIDVKKLKNNYAIGSTDASTCWLTVKP